MQCDTDLHTCSEMNTTPLCSAELNSMCQSFIKGSFNNAEEYWKGKGMERKEGREGKRRKGINSFFFFLIRGLGKTTPRTWAWSACCNM